MTIATNDPAVLELIPQVVAAYKEHTGKDCPLTNEQVATVIVNTEDELDAGGWADAIDDAHAMLNAGDDTELSSAADIASMSAQGLSEIGVRFGAKLSSDEWTSFFDESNKSKEFAKKASVYACILLAKTFTQAEIDEIPVYGVPMKDEKTGAINSNPDIYSYKVPGTKRHIPKHKVYDIFDASAKGISIRAEITRHEKAYNACKNGGDADRELVNMGIESVEADLKLWRGRLNSGRRDFREGLALHRKMQAVSEMPLLVAAIAYDERKNVRRSTSCIEIANKSGRTHQFVTPTSFLRMDIDKAMKAGGTIADLIATVGKGSGAGGTEGGEDKAMPKTAIEVLGMVQAVNMFAMSGTDDDNAKAALAIRATMEGKGGDEAVRAYGKLIVWLDAHVWKHISKRYDTLEAQEVAHMQQSDDKEKEAKRAKLAAAFAKGTAKAVA